MKLSRKRAAQIAHQLAPLYKAAGWGWGEAPTVPSEEAISTALVELAKRMGPPPALFIRSGGLAIVRERDELGEWQEPYIAFEWRFPWKEEE